jgi:glycosyltransferase involved in cell wall biosynthesis
MEKPVVATGVGGIPDLVKDGVNGVLVTPGNVDELAGALEKMLIDKGLAQKMGREGRKRIKEQFSSEIMARSIERVYRELMTVKGIPFEN